MLIALWQGELVTTSAEAFSLKRHINFACTWKFRTLLQAQTMQKGFSHSIQTFLLLTNRLIAKFLAFLKNIFTKRQFDKQRRFKNAIILIK